mgnify:FL=1
MQFFIKDHLYTAGRDECGEEVVGTVYHIVAEDSRGARYSSPVSFADTGKAEYDEDGFQYFLFDDKAASQAQEALSRCRRFVTDSEVAGYWGSIEACYGSAAYQS